MLKIKGPFSIDFKLLTSKVEAVNPLVDPLILLAYKDLGAHYGIDGAVAIAHACLESDWFRSARARAYHNYCGLGANSATGIIGFVSDSPILGVLAHLAHLQRYTSDVVDPLCVAADPRYLYVERTNVGQAVYVDDLGGPGRWTDDLRYGYDIWRVYIELGGK